ncbi:hypothetical protein DSO57_1029944 [Entomophthora muscae]|uniref:Uncharacterized protein n=1 Tax=Entomophthora muscae TaxID=34485 RepID=A0ACC2TZB6_9FUNG|nr:hypothetical protein DSO57_1029944 [Entomophthora muscae]
MLGAILGLILLVLMLGLICLFLSWQRGACDSDVELSPPEVAPEYQFPDYGIVELSIDSGLDQFSSFSNNSANKNMGVPGFTNTSSAQGLGTRDGFA